MIKGRQQIKIIKRRGATSAEAVDIVLDMQDREIKRLNAECERLQRVANEAVAAMDQDEADRFFGVS